MSDTPYYVTALAPEIQKSWGDHHIYGKPDHIAEMCGYRMLTSFYDDGFPEIHNRRELLYHRLASFYQTDDEAILPRVRGILPVDSVLPKIVDTLATAYADPPTRRWVTGGAEAPESSILRGIFERDGIDGRLQAALRRAKLLSGCIVGAYVGARGRWQVQIVPLDLCRFETHEQFPDQLTSITFPLVREHDEHGKPIKSDGDSQGVRVYQVWTDTEIRYENGDGEEDFFWEPDEDDDGNPIIGDDGVPARRAVVRRSNPYGRIPYTILRLVEPDSMATFGGGLAWAADTMCAINGIETNADLSAHFEAHGHWVAVNLGLTEGKRPRFGIGGMTAIDNVDGAQERAAPSLQNVAQNGSYGQLAEYRTERIKDLMRAAGVPESEIQRGGNAPSGVARYIERKPLLEQRRSDIRNLTFFEREFSDLLIRVYNADIAERSGGKVAPIPERLPLEVTFADEDLILEPKDLADLTNARADAGLISPSRYVRDMTGQTVASDEAAVELIRRNRALFAAIDAGEPVESESQEGVADTPTATPADGGDAAAELRTSVGGSAQIAERQAEYYEGKVPREAVLANLEHVLGFTRAEAEALLPEVLPTPLAAIAAEQVPTPTTNTPE